MSILSDADFLSFLEGHLRTKAKDYGEKADLAGSDRANADVFDSVAGTYLEVAEMISTRTLT